MFDDKMSSHEGVTCDFCYKTDFAEKRYKCRSCFDYDLCESCFNAGNFSKDHKIHHPVWILQTKDDFDKELSEFQTQMRKLSKAYNYPTYFANLNHLVTVTSSQARSASVSTQTTYIDLGQLNRDFKKLMINDSAAYDVKFIVRGRIIPAHKAVLVARSPVFSSMFQHDMAERNSGVVKIDEFSPESFQTFLTFLYSADVLEDLTWNNVVEVHDLANKYLVDGLKDVCRMYMTQTMGVGSFCDYLALAQKHVDPDMLECAKTFFKENAKSIVCTAKWKEFLGVNPSTANEMLIAAFSAS